MKRLTLASASLIVLFSAQGGLALSPPPTAPGPISAVPEPMGALVFAAGAALVAVALRRRGE
ncbi:MAG: hypothetical protein CL910_01750 [Deltaproteobacteria bacterium]|jgi:hypothetical protein|nr:hypothetical protein [Deltaproteobacteria bacterium]